jgi:hypothetical protein
MVAVIEPDAENLAGLEWRKQLGDLGRFGGFLESGIEVSGAAHGGLVGFL